MAARPGRLMVKAPTRRLYIGSNHERDLWLILVDDKKILYRRHIKAGANTESLLTNIEAFLKSVKVRPQGLVLNQDNLSFSQGRVLMSLINTLAYVWQVPVAKGTVSRVGEGNQAERLVWQKQLAADY
ncbi:TPA: hypothetical protein DEB72_01375 [Patescibacteria group bacterium]|nr:hypothetical protein [Patescibacteria group bacterium]